MNIQELQYWIGFARFVKFGAIRMKKIYTHFPSLEQAWNAPAEKLLVAGLDEDLVGNFIEFKKTIDLEKECEDLIRHNVHVVPVTDRAYPPLLKELHDAPALLFVRGNVQALSHEPLLSVVGARRISPYGEKAVSHIVGPLVRAGVTIVSGLALGTDGLAHQAALDTAGNTIAVLGCGVDTASVYPPEHARLADRIVAAGGAVVSEFPIGTKPLPHHFPMRNRIISGLSFGTLIVEAASTSGALITAYAALDQNRDVFAVPGNIMSPLSEGTNALLKRGAIPVTAAEDILAHLHLRAPADPPRPLPRLAGPEQAVFDLIALEPMHIDDLIDHAKVPASDISRILTMLELKGLVKQVGGQHYTRA